jgi:hypothetical protein
MTKPIEQSEFADEVSELLTAVVLGDATDAQISRLNELLLREEALRHHAARFLEEEAVLRREFQVLDRVVAFHKPVGKDLCGEISLSNEATAVCETRLEKKRRQLLFLAVAVLICALVGTIWFERRSSTSAVNHLTEDADSRTLPMNQSGEGASPQNQMPLAASMLSRVTYVSWAGPRFASDLSAEPLTSSLREGVIPFTSAFGRPAQGYMVCLQPRAFLELVVAADADSENSLAVIEFDRSGRPTGRRLTFSNSAGEDKRAPDAGKFSTLTKKGRLGIWTERNDSAGARYYLLTAVHKLLNRSVDDSWHVSRLLSFVEEADLVHIGWDDSGMLSTGDQDHIHIPDDDFDDVSATIRIRNPNLESTRRAGAHVYSKTAQYESGLDRTAVSDLDRYAFSVAPGRVAIVKVCSRSAALVEVAVFEEVSGKVKWRCRKEGSRSPTLGLCAIENNTPDPKNYIVVGQTKAPTGPATEIGSTSSRQLSHSILFDKEGLVTVGFDDGKKVSDFDRVKVDILTVGDL